MSEDFIYGNKIKIIFENEELAVLYKPQGLPTAPIKKDEKGTLVNLFLSSRPKSANVIGKKEIEAGLIHRLDTPTCGLVIFAKTQETYNELNEMQMKNLITKTYFAFCNVKNEKFTENLSFPYKIISQFDAFGPKRKKVIPVFKEGRRFRKDGKMYTTTILSLKKVFKDKALVTCSLTQGFRHQVRSHLSYYGLPICGDALYNKNYTVLNEEENPHNYPLQLYASGISFPKPKSSTDFSKAYLENNYISFSLPPPNKMNP